MVQFQLYLVRCSVALETFLLGLVEGEGAFLEALEGACAHSRPQLSNRSRSTQRTAAHGMHLSAQLSDQFDSVLPQCEADQAL